MKCNTCDYEYTSFFEDTNQAYGCAATLYLMNGDFYILAHYGSDYDMQRYALKRDKYKVGTICDDCIKKYIENGNAHLIEDGVW
jgi:hypothetical protein